MLNGIITWSQWEKSQKGKHLKPRKNTQGKLGGSNHKVEVTPKQVSSVNSTIIYLFIVLWLENKKFL